MYEIQPRAGVTVTPEMTAWLADVNEKMAPLIEAAMIELYTKGCVTIGEETIYLDSPPPGMGRALVG